MTWLSVGNWYILPLLGFPYDMSPYPGPEGGGRRSKLLDAVAVGLGSVLEMLKSATSTGGGTGGLISLACPWKCPGSVELIDEREGMYYNASLSGQEP